MNLREWGQLARRLDRDQRGAVSLETILIVGAIALPILIFLLRIGWPKVQGLFSEGLDKLDSESKAASQG